MNLAPVPGGTPRVCGVVVTFFPNLDVLRRQLELIRPQLDTLVIVDNGSDTDLTPLAKEFNAELLALSENLGIATAQNRGINIARTLQTDYVLLLDQDSLPATDMVAELLSAAQTLSNQTIQFAAVGANYIDPRQGESGAFVYRKGLKLKRRTASSSLPIVESDFLIASGCLIPMPVLDAVGEMVEELFIDYVDIEWGLRARSFGYSCFGVFAAQMEHSLGDDHIPFRDHRVPLHSPLRHYYQLRNAIWLTKQSWLPRVWTVLLTWRMIRQFLFFSIAAPNGLKHARMMASGVYDGFIGKMGRK